MKFHAFSLIAMFMVTANALTIPMDSMDGASGLVKRQDSGPTFTPTNGPKLRPTVDLIFNTTPTFTPTNGPKLSPTVDLIFNTTPTFTHTDEPTHVLKSDPTHTPIFSAIL
ncbi:hypothetical protein BASA60_003452 [Batrachochytrium salamandrivorans]|nr:hypothetical protein BASA60_003452 [Batrachochytrium salamandrivorans]